MSFEIAFTVVDNGDGTRSAVFSGYNNYSSAPLGDYSVSGHVVPDGESGFASAAVRLPNGTSAMMGAAVKAQVLAAAPEEAPEAVRLPDSPLPVGENAPAEPAVEVPAAEVPAEVPVEVQTDGAAQSADGPVAG